MISTRAVIVCALLSITSADLTNTQVNKEAFNNKPDEQKNTAGHTQPAIRFALNTTFTCDFTDLFSF